jgi:hypothetical protein
MLSQQMFHRTQSSLLKITLTQALVPHPPLGIPLLIITLAIPDIITRATHNPATHNPATHNLATHNLATHNPAIHNPAIHNPAIHNPAIHNLATHNLVIQVLQGISSVTQEAGEDTSMKGALSTVIMHKTLLSPPAINREQVNANSPPVHLGDEKKNPFAISKRDHERF